MPQAPRILRVFAGRNDQTPADALTAVGFPGLFRPPAAALEAIHVSATFTWHKDRAERIADAWRHHYPGVPVLVGGPAFGDPGGEFVAGRYVRPGITFTTRGCPNRCPFCAVPEREGRLRCLETIAPGTVVQDNNILAAPRAHFRRVCAMLAEAKPIYDRQRHKRAGANFRGGLEAARLTDWHVERLRGLKIDELWFAYDRPGIAYRATLSKALRKVRHLDRRHLRCYVLIGYDPGETLDGAEARLVDAAGLGTTPYAQLYQPLDARIRRPYPKAWRDLAAAWSWPGRILAAVEDHRERHDIAPY